jgi:CDP-diacylglycerol--glycerol-3-phosphate 3-phosphatidyltransferase
VTKITVKEGENMKRSGWFFKNMANFITGTRFVLVFWIGYLLFFEPWQIALIIFAEIVCAATDFADGILARKLRIISLFGAFFDAMTDKLLLFVTFIGLIWNFWPPKSLPEWLAFLTQYLTFVFLILEVFFAGSAVFGYLSGQRDFSSIMVGRKKMNFAVSAAIIWFLAVGLDYFWDINFYLPAALAINLCLVMAIHYWIESAPFYWSRFKKFL